MSYVTLRDFGLLYKVPLNLSSLCHSISLNISLIIFDNSLLRFSGIQLYAITKSFILLPPFCFVLVPRITRIYIRFVEIVFQGSFLLD